MRSKPSLVEKLSNSSAAFNIVAFIVGELLGAIALVLRVHRGTTKTGYQDDAWGDSYSRYTYRSIDMERRRTGISDRRQCPNASTVQSTAERRKTPDRRSNPWDMHPA